MAVDPRLLPRHAVRNLTVTDPEDLADSPYVVALSPRLNVALSFMNVQAMMALGMFPNPLLDTIQRQADTEDGEEGLAAENLDMQPIRPEPELDPETGEPRLDPVSGLIVYKPLTLAQRRHNIAVRAKNLEWNDNIFKNTIVAPPYADLDELRAYIAAHPECKRQFGGPRVPGKLDITHMTDDEIAAALDELYGSVHMYESFRTEPSGPPASENGATYAAIAQRLDAASDPAATADGTAPAAADPGDGLDAGSGADGAPGADGMASA